jgi:hypothetical protein
MWPSLDPPRAALPTIRVNRALTSRVGIWRLSLRCINFDAMGGTADIDRPPTPIASEAYDPERRQAGSKFRSAARPSCPNFIVRFSEFVLELFSALGIIGPVSSVCG